MNDESSISVFHSVSGMLQIDRDSLYRRAQVSTTFHRKFGCEHSSKVSSPTFRTAIVYFLEVQAVAEAQRNRKLPTSS